ncbi:MAG: RIP metalloprotease RseP [Azoarcus sp.]|jgi:regulator of sigma E protease|nr:RIP metalloprotease RseP [Azoarcus sp.]
MSILNILTQYVIPFIIAIGLLILVHEMGHYLVARMCGVKVLKFSIGFGKPLLKWTAKNGTEWVLAAFPLGGFVKMLGEGAKDEIDEQESRWAFNRKPVEQRIAIVAAGPIFNLLLAVVLYWGLFVAGTTELRPLIATTQAESSLAQEAGVRNGDLVLSVNGEKVRSWEDLRWALVEHAISRDEARLEVRTREGTEAVRILDLSNFSFQDASKEDLVFRMGLRPTLGPALLSYVEEGGPAAKGGVLKDDEIIAIDGEPVSSSFDVVDAVRRSPDKTRAFTVRRDGKEQTFSITLDKKQHNDEIIGFAGIAFDNSFMFAEVRDTPFEAVGHALSHTWQQSVLTLKSIGKIITGFIPANNISGPLTIADLAGKSAQHGLPSFIKFLALISISLGVLNLLPIPVLDGGHLLYYAVELIKGSALSERSVEIGQMIGLGALLLLMAFAIFNDINRLIS